MEALSNLGIDLWSILLYAVNMGILLFVIGKFVVPKILRYLDERRNQIQNNLTEADLLKQKMEEQQEAMRKEREEMSQKIQQELEQTRKTLEAKRKEAEAEIEAKKTKMLEEVQVTIAQEKGKLIHDAQSQMLDIVQRMITYIVSNELPPETIKNSVAKSWEKFKN